MFDPVFDPVFDRERLKGLMAEQIWGSGCPHAFQIEVTKTKCNYENCQECWTEALDKVLKEG